MFVLSHPVPRTTASLLGAAPFNRLVDRLFDDSFDRLLGRTTSSTRTPALDVSETDTAYTLAFDVPGAVREQLQVSVEGRRVSIETAEAPAPEAAPSTGVVEAPKNAPRALYRERAEARYARTVSLPSEVDQNASQAKFENGVLTLTLAKKIADGAKLLSVN